MMIECPRCGFAQPKDQYCASCGLNIDQYRAPTKSLLARFLNNPNLHLALIGISIALVIGWIFYTQRGLVGKEMGHLLDLPVSSKDAGDPADQRNEQQKQAAQVAAREAAQPEPAQAPAPTPEAMGGAKGAAPADPTAADANASDPSALGTAAAPGSATVAAANTGPKTKMEVSFWEIPREVLAGLTAGGERVGEGNGGRALYFAQGTKFLEGLQSQTQGIGAPKNSALNTGSQILFETPQTGTEVFQFLMQVEVTKVEGKEVSIHWENTMILPQGSEPAVGPPNLSEASLMGNSPIATTGVVVLVIEPSNRQPAEQYVSKAGPGPWTIFSSQEFRGGLTDWIAVIQLK